MRFQAPPVKGASPVAGAGGSASRTTLLRSDWASSPKIRPGTGLGWWHSRTAGRCDSLTRPRLAVGGQRRRASRRPPLIVDPKGTWLIPLTARTSSRDTHGSDRARARKASHRGCPRIRCLMFGQPTPRRSWGDRSRWREPVLRAPPEAASASGGTPDPRGRKVLRDRGQRRQAGRLGGSAACR
jgi:hypothetical protein